MWCLSRMLKKPHFPPAQPQRAATRFSPCFVLGSSKSSTYLRMYASGASIWCGLARVKARLGARAGRVRRPPF